MSENKIDIEKLVEERRESDEKLVKELNEKYNMDVKQFTSTSPLWHRGLIWDEQKFNAKLKRCPFCGGEAEIASFEYSDGMTYVVECKGCRTQSGEYDEMIEAFVNWNKRVEE